MNNSVSTQVLSIDLGVIAIQGVDAAKFLQGQVTCDIRELAEQANQPSKIALGGQCNVKGRLLMVFHAVQVKSDLIHLLINAELVESSIANLRKYAVFFKVALTNVTDQWNCLALTGPATDQTLSKLFGNAPTQSESWIQLDNHQLLKFNDYLFVLCLNKQSSDWSNQEAELRALLVPSTQTWSSLLIEHGIPEIHSSTLELFTPQDVNLPTLNGVSFKKGCYTGQEIVARLHYKATLKRHMYRFELETNQAVPQPGDKLRDSEGKSLGEVVSAARRDASRIELLASINDAGVSDAFVEGNSQKLRQLPLPYAIPSENGPAVSK